MWAVVQQHSGAGASALFHSVCVTVEMSLLFDFLSSVEQRALITWCVGWLKLGQDIGLLRTSFEARGTLLSLHSYSSRGPWGWGRSFPTWAVIMDKWVGISVHQPAPDSPVTALSILRGECEGWMVDSESVGLNEWPLTDTAGPLLAVIHHWDPTYLQKFLNLPRA